MTKTTGNVVYVVDGNRSPFLKAKGKPGPFSAADLAVASARPLLAKQRFDPHNFDEVILGCVMPGPDEANIARVVALRLGCGERVTAWTVQRNCASGMQALDCAAQSIASGRAQLVLAGGVEAMSHAPILFSQKMASWLGMWYGARSMGARAHALSKFRLPMLAPVIGLLRGLTDPIVGLSMGQTAENLAHRFRISRHEMDNFALRSHNRLAKAQDEGLIPEITTIYANNGDYFTQDDGVRRDSDMTRLSKLKPAFDKPFGNVTAGNSAQVTDGAAWLILASAQAVKQYQLTPIGRIRDCQWAGLDPAQMGLGPAYAMAPLLKSHKLGIQDVDFWEINEAFAAQVLACVAAWRDTDFCRNELGWDHAIGELDMELLNIDGGAISIGHPVGASGARIVLHILQILARKQAKRGIASLCIGGGQGGAMLLERD